MTSDETQIQIFANWPLTFKTRDILLAASLLAFRLRRQNSISRALTIPPAMQATQGRFVFITSHAFD